MEENRYYLENKGTGICIVKHTFVTSKLIVNG